MASDYATNRAVYLFTILQEAHALVDPLLRQLEPVVFVIALSVLTKVLVQAIGWVGKNKRCAFIGQTAHALNAVPSDDGVEWKSPWHWGITPLAEA